MGTVQKGMPHKCYHGKTGSLQFYPACCWHHCKQTRARFLPRELMCVSSVLSTLRAEITSWNMWRKMIRKTRKPKRKGLGLSWSASLFHPEKHTSWGPMERNPNCWSPFPMNSWPDGYKNKDLDCTNVSLNWVEVLCPNSVVMCFQIYCFFFLKDVTVCCSVCSIG